MSKRLLIIVLACAACLGTVWALVRQGQQLSGLREQQQELAAPRDSANADSSAAPIQAGSGGDGSIAATGSAAAELLRLRGEVTRLNARKRELSSEVAEGDRLRAQLAAGSTNAALGSRLPPGYIRKTQAQMVGYTTPENTVQSFLWAIHNHDLTAMLRALTPESAEHVRAQVQSVENGTADFFKNADVLPGMAIRSREDLPDGTVQLQVEIGPGLPGEKVHLQIFNGEWKMNGPF